MTFDRRETLTLDPDEHDQTARTMTNLARRRWTIPRQVGYLTLALLFAAVTVLILRSTDKQLSLNPDQRTMINRLESVLLHDTSSLQYTRVVNQLDGRGYASGIGDFATADGGALEVVQAYTARVGKNPLSSGYLQILTKLAADGNADVSRLTGFPQAWTTAAADPVFRQAQDDVLQTRHYQPALKLAQGLGINTPLGLAILYDSLLQHGDGTDHDGLPALVAKANARARGTPQKAGERSWLGTLLAVRRADLASPDNPEHQRVWPYATGRVDALAGLLTAHHDQLEPPLVVTPYGTAHSVDLSPLDDTTSLPSTLPTTALPAPVTTRLVPPSAPGKTKFPSATTAPRAVRSTPAALVQQAGPQPSETTISGHVTCLSGNPVSGVWVEAQNGGSGWSPWWPDEDPSGATFGYRTTIGPWQVHIGCGGSQDSWQVATYSAWVVTSTASLTCDDIAGQRRYGQCWT